MRKEQQDAMANTGLGDLLATSLQLLACGSETSTAQINKVFLLLLIHKK
jgi:hypothetical protein